jgi:hypothetical protein
LIENNGLAIVPASAVCALRGAVRDFFALHDNPLERSVALQLPFSAIRPREVVMIDTYSKVIFTVIAVALSVIALRPFVQHASAFGGNCGIVIAEPCYVSEGLTPLKVTVK